MPTSTSDDEPAARRAPYTYAEDMNILNYIINKKLFDRVKGRAMWECMAVAMCTKSYSRSWHSLKERYRKHIVPNVRQYNLDPTIIPRIEEPYFVKERARKVPKKNQGTTFYIHRRQRGVENAAASDESSDEKKEENTRKHQSKRRLLNLKFSGFFNSPLHRDTPGKTLPRRAEYPQLPLTCKTAKSSEPGPSKAKKLTAIISSSESDSSDLLPKHKKKTAQLTDDAESEPVSRPATPNETFDQPGSDWPPMATSTPFATAGSAVKNSLLTRTPVIWLERCESTTADGHTMFPKKSRPRDSSQTSPAVTNKTMFDATFNVVGRAVEKTDFSDAIPSGSGYKNLEVGLPLPFNVLTTSAVFRSEGSVYHKIRYHKVRNGLSQNRTDIHDGKAAHAQNEDRISASRRPEIASAGLSPTNNPQREPSPREANSLSQNMIASQEMSSSGWLCKPTVVCRPSSADNPEVSQVILEGENWKCGEVTENESNEEFVGETACIDSDSEHSCTISSSDEEEEDAYFIDPIYAHFADNVMAKHVVVMDGVKLSLGPIPFPVIHPPS